MIYTIYKTTNLKDGKIYVGMHRTENLNDSYIGSGKLLWHAINKHGIEHFRKEILFIFDNEDAMILKEKELVTEEFCLREDTYNICPGGHGGFGYIVRNKLANTPLQRQKARDNIKNVQQAFADKILSNDILKDAWKDKLSKSMKLNIQENGHIWNGRNHSEESKKKIGAANSLHQSGNKNSQFGSMWITNGTDNKKIKNTDSIPNGWTRGRK